MLTILSPCARSHDEGADSVRLEEQRNDERAKYMGALVRDLQGTGVERPAHRLLLHLFPDQVPSSFHRDRALSFSLSIPSSPPSSALFAASLLYPTFKKTVFAGGHLSRSLTLFLPPSLPPSLTQESHVSHRRSPVVRQQGPYSSER